MAKTEVWMRGPVEGFDPLLQPVAHSLLQVKEELEALAPMIADGQLWARPGGAASVGFHVLHIGNALDRLYTYARGDALSAAQIETLKAETAAKEASYGDLLAATSGAIDRALDQLRATPADALPTERKLGRAGIP